MKPAFDNKKKRSEAKRSEAKKKRPVSWIIINYY